VLDIDGIEIPAHLLQESATEEDLEELRRILHKRALIIAHQMQITTRASAACKKCCRFIFTAAC
ncbi:MAG: hypothetical protein D3914_15115, partial [Candidatus Electrothrix sp. LOE2]|nr:hypothetical protein [Candidatus Electrothrix sp. LOE2]